MTEPIRVPGNIQVDPQALSDALMEALPLAVFPKPILRAVMMLAAYRAALRLAMIPPKGVHHLGAEISTYFRTLAAECTVPGIREHCNLFSEKPAAMALFQASEAIFPKFFPKAVA